jgi:hypothetical protein
MNQVPRTDYYAGFGGAMNVEGEVRLGESACQDGFDTQGDEPLLMRVLPALRSQVDHFPAQDNLFTFILVITHKYSLHAQRRSAAPARKVRQREKQERKHRHESDAHG